jgi:putative MATE family efflux protein
MSTAVAEARPVAAFSLWKSFVLFLIPMMLSNVLQSLSGTVNSIFLGQMIGVRALAAVSTVFPILFLLISFLIGVSSGATVLIGQAYGANELVRLKAVVGTALTVSILLGLIVAGFGGTFAQSILLLIGTPPDILADATEYARVVLLSGPLLFVFILYTSIVRGSGDAVTPLLALALSGVVTLTLTPALIQGWGGLPRLGVASGAYASTIGYLVTIVALWFYLLWKRHPMAPDRVLLRHLRIDWTLLKTLLRIGIPTGVQLLMISAAEIAVLSFVNDFGSQATAAYGAVNQIASYVQLPAISISITSSIFGAQAIGRGDISRLGAITRTGIALNLAVTGGLVALTYAFSRTVLGWFIASPAVVDIAQELVHITLWSYVPFGMAGVVAGVMRSSGTVLWPMVIAIFAICGIEVPVAYVLTHGIGPAFAAAGLPVPGVDALVHGIGLKGVWVAYPVAFVAMLAMQTLYYRLVWRKKTITRLI